MICNTCGTNNEAGFKFCVKCGSNLDDPSEVNYEQVDMGGYHTEEEFSEENGAFTMDSGTFTIRTSAPPASSLYTADELNQSEEEFDFSMYDDPAAPAAAPQPTAAPMNQQPIQPPPMMNNMPNMAQPMQGIPNMPQQPIMPSTQTMGAMQQPMGMNPYQQPMMYAQPQIIGYDQNGMPIYGQPQPMMYAQPQIIGYDQSGMPIYGQPQPMMYAQPQIIGYDQNGMPIYGQPQPVMYAQPQIIGYDQNGMPIYGQPPMPEPQHANYGIPPIQPQPNRMPVNGMTPQSGMPGIPPPGMMGIPQPQPAAEKKQESSKEDFWAFFDNGKSDKLHEETSADDFFGKSSRDGMNDLNMAGMDMNALRHSEKKKTSYMNDTPIVDAADLQKNEADKFNKFFMRQTEAVNADDLQANTQKKQQDFMGVTREVNADMLSANSQFKTRFSMDSAGEADPDLLKNYVPEHKEALMAQADHAVEALPKRVNPYESELDKIELPEYMQAKKTIRSEEAEIPSIPQVGEN